MCVILSVLLFLLLLLLFVRSGTHRGTRTITHVWIHALVYVYCVVCVPAMLVFSDVCLDCGMPFYHARPSVCHAKARRYFCIDLVFPHSHTHTTHIISFHRTEETTTTTTTSILCCCAIWSLEILATAYRAVATNSCPSIRSTDFLAFFFIHCHFYSKFAAFQRYKITHTL